MPAAVVVDSANWSGYAVSSGPFSQITGTLGAHHHERGHLHRARRRVVGIDGWNAPTLPEDTYLIQAGVDASMTDPDTGTCTPGKFYVWPWWEILPQNETPITTVTVNAGDQVTVSISQLSGTSTWAISLPTTPTARALPPTRLTRGRRHRGNGWSRRRARACAPGASKKARTYANWRPTASVPAVRAPAPYRSDMPVDGTQTDWWEAFMVQDNATVATPSVLGDGGFSVAYTGTQASVASPAAGGGPVLAAGSQPRDKVLRQPISQG